jgi:nickel-dependent lactate racemase
MDHSESKNLVNREKVDRRVSDSVGVKQDVNKKQACKKKSLSQSAVQSPSSAVDSGGLKVDESGNERYNKGLEIVDFDSFAFIV